MPELFLEAMIMENALRGWRLFKPACVVWTTLSLYVTLLLLFVTQGDMQIVAIFSAVTFLAGWFIAAVITLPGFDAQVWRTQGFEQVAQGLWAAAFWITPVGLLLAGPWLLLKALRWLRRRAVINLP